MCNAIIFYNLIWINTLNKTQMENHIKGYEEFFLPLYEKSMSCPVATQDLKLNTKNRDKSIKEDHIKYGPLNVDEPGDYWKDLAKHWDTEVEVAKKSKCSNCIAFDISPRMKECMPIEDVKGGLGYCWMHDFKCHEDRTCYTWAKGGPITKDEKSKKNQMRREEK